MSSANLSDKSTTTTTTTTTTKIQLEALYRNQVCNATLRHHKHKKITKITSSSNHMKPSN